MFNYARWVCWLIIVAVSCKAQLKIIKLSTKTQIVCEKIEINSLSSRAERGRINSSIRFDSRVQSPR